MRLPILYALAYPERIPNDLKLWNPVETPNLTFEQIDHDAFPALSMAKIAVGVGGTMPCAFNAANEEAANAFLRGDVKFLQITEIVAEVMERHTAKPVTLDNLLHTDSEARATARDLMKSASAR
jgi:1-deoxy-D-xylulose-5-phosphate reductoisomerase